MEIAVLIHRVNGTGYRAATGDPLPAAAEGASREEALGKLRTLLEEQMRSGAELVRMRIAGPQTSPSTPVWPDDALTRDWLSGISEARRAADQAATIHDFFRYDRLANYAGPLPGPLTPEQTEWIEGRLRVAGRR